KVVQEAIIKQGDRDKSRWRLDVDIAVRANHRAPEPQRQKASELSGMLRAEIRREILYHFNALILRGALADLFLMRDVLVWYDSIGCQENEVPLAHAFNVSIGKSSTFMKIPESMTRQVQLYVDALRAVEARGDID